MRILVTGTTGQVGHDLLDSLAPLGEVVPAERGSMDFRAPDSIERFVSCVAPDVIVNPAAYTAVDRAQDDEATAMLVNGVAPGVLAEQARRLGAWLVHYSTDYVFDGARAGAYAEDDPVAPLNAYGRTKLEGERRVAASGCRHLILRTSWVYSLRGRNFLTTMARLATERPELRVVADQVGAPTTSRAIARATSRLVASLLDAGQAAGQAQRGPREGPDRAVPQGVYHMTCAGATSWYGFACAIVARLPAVTSRLGLPCPAHAPAVVPIVSEQYPTPAPRPRNSVLDNAKLARDFGVHLPDWESALDELLRGA